MRRRFRVPLSLLLLLLPPPSILPGNQMKSGRNNGCAGTPEQDEDDPRSMFKFLNDGFFGPSWASFDSQDRDVRERSEKFAENPVLDPFERASCARAIRWRSRCVPSRRPLEELHGLRAYSFVNVGRGGVPEKRVPDPVAHVLHGSGGGGSGVRTSAGMGTVRGTRRMLATAPTNARARTTDGEKVRTDEGRGEAELTAAGAGEVPREIRESEHRA
ncbi:hypothetical protein DFH09DRAFT_1102892 [Mycena vulgaris]|nr:hypothetical protein DFH09DRAFT_1102892 [Mycena vulgaris]